MTNTTKLTLSPNKREKFLSWLKSAFVIIFITSILFILFKYQPDVNALDNREIQIAEQLIKERKDNPKRLRVILLWNKVWGIKNWGYSRLPSVDFIAHGCEETNCIVTDNKALLREADAVIFHAYDNMKNVPHFRLPHQRYIFMVHEPPCNIPQHKYDFLNSAFNWTQTYRWDSDIPMPYGVVCKRDKPKKMNYDEILKKKKKSVAWMVSNCEAPSKRLEYVKELMKYIPVDVYGKCAKLLGQNNVCGRKTRDQCMQMLGREYRFYLAFENCLTKDYITEKYLDMLSINIVPVVRGDGNYSSIGPTNSFINTRNFKSPKDLASYLLELSKDDKKYVKYLKWKEKYNFDPEGLECSNVEFGHCLLCKKLNNPNEPKKFYKDIKKWHGKCREADDIPYG